ncbi:MAG TPA: Txe/YoeB family addiction module toxin [Telluria sp.]|nr:Txe/YoeB family addiction module toxin [Telluria sp.]
MRKLLFTDASWNDYLYWQAQDKRTLRRINTLIKEAQRDPAAGMGKPEPLKGNMAGYWSRRIDETNRLVYKFDNDTVTIISCRYHYQ